MLVHHLRPLCRTANSRTDSWWKGNRSTVCAISFSTPQIAVSAGKIAGTAFCHEANSGRNIKLALTILSSSINTTDTEVQSTYFAITSIRHSKRNCPNSQDMVPLHNETHFRKVWDLLGIRTAALRGSYVKEVKFNCTRNMDFQNSKWGVGGGELRMP